MTTDFTPIPFTSERLIEAAGGEFLCKNAENIFSSISINSKEIKKDGLFIAIKGENHDGHDFINDVIEAGVKGVIINDKKKDLFPVEKWNKNGVTCLAVEDTITALGALARSQRIEAEVKVIAVTGSNGKTSTRALTSAIFEQRYKTLSTAGNFNNEIGLPLTLLRLSKKHEWAVVELGMNAPGEIERLAEICKPDIGIITNVGTAHLEGLGSIENIARAKAELLPAIDKNGAAILNCNIPLLDELTKNIKSEVLIFGESEKSNIKADSISTNGNNVNFQINSGNGSFRVNLKTPGIFMVSNALAAASAGFFAGLEIRKIKKGLESFSPVKGRMNIIKTSKGYNFIDDTYNANPDSMMAAITTLKNLKGNNKGFFIAGDMLELGDTADFLHEKVGAFAADSGIEELYVTGKNAEHVSNGAKKNGMGSESVFTGTKKEIINKLSAKLNKNDWVLVKGSRSMAMEEIIEVFSKGA